MCPDRTSRNKKEIENQAIPIAMPSGVPAADVTHAVFTAPSMGDSSLSTHTEDNLVPLPPLPPLRSVWDCPRLKRGQSQGVEKKGKSNGWQCGHCKGFFIPITPRPLRVLLRNSGVGQLRLAVQLFLKGKKQGAC